MKRYFQICVKLKNIFIEGSVFHIDRAIEELFKQYYPILSPIQRKITDLIMRDPEEYTMLTITECSKKLEVSEASLTRFAKALDFKGYHDFQNSLKSNLLNQLTPKVKMEKTLQKSAASTNRIEKELLKDIETLSKALQTINHEQFQKVVASISQAECVYLMGLGVSKSIVSFLDFRLRRIGIETKIFTSGGHEFMEKLLPIQSKDIVLAIGFQRSYSEIITALDYTQKKGIQAISLVENALSPLARKASTSLIVKRGPKEELNSLALPMSICNAIMMEVTLIKERRALETMEQLEWINQTYKRYMEEN